MDIHLCERSEQPNQHIARAFEVKEEEPDGDTELRYYYYLSESYLKGEGGLRHYLKHAFYLQLIVHNTAPTHDAQYKHSQQLIPIIPISTIFIAEKYSIRCNILIFKVNSQYFILYLLT